MGDTVKQDATGVVSTYKREQGYGFLTTVDVPDQHGASVDVFFHITDVPAQSVEEGWRFRFELTETDEGYRATNIAIISKKTVESPEPSEPKRHGLNKPMGDVDDTLRNPIRAERRKNRDTDEDSDSDDGPDSPFADDRSGSMNDLL